MKTYIGLYYPFIHFRDDSWIKLAALYWDKMGRIVPRGYKTRDSDTVERLSGERGFVENVNVGFYSSDRYPDSDEYPNELNLDEAFINLLKQHEAALRVRYGVSQRHKWPDVSATQAAHLGTDPKLAYVYIEKMPSDLIEAFISTELALADHDVYDEQGHWLEMGRVGMHPRLADLYMTALAEEIAKNTGYYPVADETLNHLALSGCTLERLAEALLGNVRLAGQAPSEREIEAVLATISLQSVIPRDIASVPTEDIITIRDRHAVERAAFQEYLQATLATMAEELQEINYRRAVQAHLEEVYKKELKPQLEALEKQLRLLNIDTITGAMNVSFDVPKAVLSGAALMGATAVNPIVGAGGAVALGMLKIVGDKRKLNEKAMQSSPVSYLLSIEKELRPTDLISWISRQARKFRFRTSSRHRGSSSTK